jgi:hypothetical protein
VKLILGLVSNIDDTLMFGRADDDGGDDDDDGGGD